MEDRIKRACKNLLARSLRNETNLKASSSAITHLSNVPPFEAFAYDLSCSRYGFCVHHSFSFRIEAQFEHDVEENDVIFVRVKSVDSVGAKVMLICFESRIRRDLSFIRETVGFFTLVIHFVQYIVPTSLLAPRLTSGQYYKVQVTAKRPIKLQFVQV